MDPTIAMVSDLGAEKAPCWTSLVEKVTGSFSFQDTSRELTVIILEGHLPRAEVESCVPEAMKSTPLPVTVERDGELSVFAGEMGKVYAAWHDDLVFISTKAGIDAVLTGPRSKEPWADRLAQLPKAPMVSTSIDPAATKLLGLPSSGYDLVITDPGQGKGTLIVRFGSPSDAAAAAKQVAENTIKWPPTPPQQLGETLAKLPMKVRGANLEIEFDRQAFGAMDGEQLDAYAKQVRDALKTP